MRKKILAQKKIDLRYFYIFFFLLVILLTIILFVPLPKINNNQEEKIGNSLQTSRLSSDFVAERKRWIELLDRSSDISQVYREFVTAYSDKAAGDQHLWAHVFGELLYQKLGNNAITICDSSYSFGCYHGVAELAIAENGVSAVTGLDDACVKTFKRQEVAPCKHGIGHGLMEFYGHRDDKLALALNACTTNHPETGIQKYFGCYAGVFMEFNLPITITNNIAKSDLRPIIKNDIYYPCASVDKQFQTACFHTIGQWWARIYNRNYKKMGILCSDVTNGDNRTACYVGIGTVVAPQSNYNASDTKKRCEQIDSQHGQILCKQSAASAFVGLKKEKENIEIILEGLSDANHKLLNYKND